MPSSLTRFHSRALVYSTHPPVSVYGTGRYGKGQRVFLGSRVEEFRSDRSFLSPCGTASFSRRLFSRLNVALCFDHCGCRIIEPAFSIVYAHRPRLRSRLTLGGRTLPRKPWVYGGREFHPAYRYSCLHSLLSVLHGWFPSRFDALTMLPYQRCGTNPTALQSFGITLIANHFRREITR